MTNTTNPADATLPRTTDDEVLDPAILDRQRAGRLNPKLMALFEALYALDEALDNEPALKGAPGWDLVKAALAGCSTKVQQGLHTAGWELPEE